ncbi:restriction endonuclease subunit S [Streptomyces werraensis]|uniref:restriction endonuclease subunit S n=1 Tax=Streptomyces werraensis TaxID=68284 RepID=UPI003429499A
MTLRTRNRWLGALPEGWCVSRLLEVADVWTSNVDKHSVEGQPAVRLCNYTDVYNNETITDDLPFMEATAKPEQIKRFRIRVNDTIITKDSETATDIGIPAFVDYEADDLICGYHLAIVRPTPGKVNPKFLFWALKSAPTMGQWSITAQGVTRVGIRSTDLSKVTISIPPINEQSNIARYLDRETARIDALITAQERFIKLLQERRDAVWAAQYERAREAGDILQLRRVISSIVDGPFGSSLTSAHYTSEGTRVIRLGNIGTNNFKNSDEAYISDDYAKKLKQHEAKAGDVLIAGLGDENQPLGRATVVPEWLGSAIVKADCFRARPAELVSGEFLAWVYSAPQTRAAIRLLARGATRQRINTGIAKAVEIPVPSREEQDKILATASEQTAKIDTLIAKTQRHIGLAKERRSALITAAVTGRIEIPKEV